MNRRSFTITQLHRDEHGIWRARVTCGSEYLDVDREDGSWMGWKRESPGARSFRRVDLRRDVAAALAEKVRPIENAERREREAAEKASRGVAV